ncbi:MAG: DinB family protein [Planctomycetia bacterium]
MNAKDVLRDALELAYRWNKMLADDLRDAPLAFPTANGGNHAVWVAGHAVVARSGLLSMITGQPDPWADWGKMLGGGSTPVADAAAYPNYEELLAAWDSVHRKTLALLDGLSEARLDEPPAAVPDELKDDPNFASVGAILLFIAMHEMSHRGQLADVRRSLGRGTLAF